MEIGEILEPEMFLYKLLFFFQMVLLFFFAYLPLFEKRNAKTSGKRKHKSRKTRKKNEKQIAVFLRKTRSNSEIFQETL